MAQIVSNEKGFKVIHVETLDMWVIGSPAKCDYCTADMATPDGGYYIAVLNKIYCPQCYKRWLSEARRHPQDAPIEARNYNTYRQILYFTSLWHRIAIRTERRPPRRRNRKRLPQ